MQYTQVLKNTYINITYKSVINVYAYVILPIYSLKNQSISYHVFHYRWGSLWKNQKRSYTPHSIRQKDTFPIFTTG